MPVRPLYPQSGLEAQASFTKRAILNTAAALELWAEAMIESGQKIPPPRSLTDLKADSEIAQALATFMVALIPYPQGLRRHAAE